MVVTISGDPKEIAALVVALQERQGEKALARKVVAEVNRQIQSDQPLR